VRPHVFSAVRAGICCGKSNKDLPTRGDMAGSDDITFERLADWLEGRLPEEEAQEMEQRLASADDATRAEADWLRGFLEISSGIVLDLPPPEVRDRLLRLPEGRAEGRTEGRREPGIFRHLVASLTLDTRAGPALAGLRSGGAVEGAQRQLVYSAEAVDLALDVRKRPGGLLDLGGQVLPANIAPEEFSVQLLRGGREFGIAAADEVGEFFFGTLTPGTYEIILSTGELEVTVGPVGLEE
jgi:hypothetical protein